MVAITLQRGFKCRQIINEICFQFFYYAASPIFLNVCKYNL